MTTATPRSKTTSRPTGSPPKPRTKGFHVIAWIERHCRFTNGEWIGRPFRLLAWQKRLILELFEVDAEDVRRYRWALVGVPKKNGKTELAAALALYFLIGDGEPSPLVVCAAASEDQADLVFGAAKVMCEQSPTLRQITECYEKEILVPSLPGAKLLRVAAVAGTNDGKNIHAVICDELHEWQGAKGEQVWNVLTNGTGARRQPMVLQITTAGFDLETVCGQQYTHGTRVASGEVVDWRYYFKWWEAPEDSDHRDPAVWAATNPSYGETVHASFFEDQLTKKPEAIFRRYFLNQWTSAETFWLPGGAWKACADLSLDLDPSAPLYVGLDLSLRNDATAVVACQRQDPRLVVRARIWENPYMPTDARYAEWRVPLGEIEAHLRDLRERFPAPASVVEGVPRPGPEFSYDPAYFRDSAMRLSGDGLAMTEYPQSDARMVPACQGLYEVIVAGVVAHDEDPALTRHLANAAAKETGRGWRLTKGRGRRSKIDGAIALAIATHRAQHAEPIPELPKPWVSFGPSRKRPKPDGATEEARS